MWGAGEPAGGRGVWKGVIYGQCGWRSKEMAETGGPRQAGCQEGRIQVRKGLSENQPQGSNSSVGVRQCCWD